MARPSGPKTRAGGLDYQGFFDKLKDVYWYWPDSGVMHSINEEYPQPVYNNAGYLVINYKKKRYLVHKLIFIWMGKGCPEIVDHINQKKDDNRWVNLREVNKRQNNTNQKLRKDNSSGYKGVYYHKKQGKYMARISHHGSMKFLGYADTALEAAKIYNEAVPLYHGEHGWVNDLGAS